MAITKEEWYWDWLQNWNSPFHAELPGSFLHWGERDDTVEGNVHVTSAVWRLNPCNSELVKIWLNSAQWIGQIIIFIPGEFAESCQECCGSVYFLYSAQMPHLGAISALGKRKFNNKETISIFIVMLCGSFLTHSVVNLKYWSKMETHLCERGLSERSISVRDAKQLKPVWREGWLKLKFHSTKYFVVSDSVSLLRWNKTQLFHDEIGGKIITPESQIA